MVNLAIWIGLSASTAEKKERNSTYGSVAEPTTGNDDVIAAAAIDRAGRRRGAEVCGARRAKVEGGVRSDEGRRASRALGDAEAFVSLSSSVLGVGRRCRKRDTDAETARLRTEATRAMTFIVDGNLSEEVR